MSIKPSYAYTQEDMQWMEGLFDDCETTNAAKCDVDFTEKLPLFVDETDEHMGEAPLLEDDVSLSAETNGSTEIPSFFESEELLSDDVSVPPVDDDVSVQSILDRHESLSTPNEEQWFKEVTHPHNDITIEIGKVVATKKVVKVVAKKAAKKVAKKFTKKSKNEHFGELLLLDRHKSLSTSLPRDITYRRNDTIIEIGKCVVTEIATKKGTKKRTFAESLDNIGKICEELFEVYKRPSTMDRTTSPSGEGTDQSSTRSTTTAALKSIDAVLAVPHGLEDTTSNTNLEPVNDIVSDEEKRVYGNKYARFFAAEDDDHYDERRTMEAFYRRPTPSPFTCKPLLPRWEHPRRVTLDGHD